MLTVLSPIGTKDGPTVQLNRVQPKVFYFSEEGTSLKTNSSFTLEST